MYIIFTSLGWWWYALLHLTIYFAVIDLNVEGLSSINRPEVKLQVRQQEKEYDESNKSPHTYSFSIPLINERPKPDTFIEKLVELWNDPRDITSLIANANDDRRTKPTDAIPYCIISDTFDVGGESFQITLFPRGKFNAVSGSSASAYLRYIPGRYGDEVDISWKLRLRSDMVDEDGTILTKTVSVSTSGGLPRSNTTWSAAMTFCTDMESVESVGRTIDWGSTIWTAREVCDALTQGNLYADGDITVFDRRSGESSFALPILQKGALGAVYKAAKGASDAARDGTKRRFRAGEVIVPRLRKGLEQEIEVLRQTFVYPGVDYRIMTISDKDGNPIFSTESLKEDNQARLALRPCGLKLQQQLWKRGGAHWPVEVNADLLSQVATTRFNFDSAIPRIVSAFQRDWVAYSLALALAIAPIPLTLFSRNFVSLYDIPSASMEPTFLKGDVLLVEKFPGIYQRTKRGDVVLFQPPPALREIVMNSGSQLSSTSLFVKRIAGLPGDQDILLVGDNDVRINGNLAVGPNRSLCADSEEPLRLIDKLLENGKGKEIARLGDDDVYVLGDCKAVSVDSRVFGALPKQNIVGKPIARLWPLNRIKISGTF